MEKRSTKERFAPLAICSILSVGCLTAGRCFAEKAEKSKNMFAKGFFGTLAGSLITTGVIGATVLPFTALNACIKEKPGDEDLDELDKEDPPIIEP